MGYISEGKSRQTTIVSDNLFSSSDKLTSRPQVCQFGPHIQQQFFSNLSVTDLTKFMPAMAVTFYPLLTLFCLLISPTLAANPAGFKARITTSALNYANTQAVNALVQQVPKMQIPNQSGRSGHIIWSLKNIHITSFNKPVSSIRLNPSRGLTWTASNAGINLHADWHAKWDQGWFTISNHGRVDGSFSRASFSLSIAVGTDTDGRPKVAADGCSCNIGHVNIKFHGNIISAILNLFKGSIERTVKKMVQSKLCDVLNSVINNNAEQQLKQLKVMTDLLDHKFLLDYRLVGSPLFDSSYMETYHKGELTWKARPQQPPFSPKTLPSSPSTQNMLYLWIGQYVPESFVYAAQTSEFLQYNLTAQDLPPGNRSFLNTTCTGFLDCVGQLIPAIGANYPHSTVELRMNSTVLPNITMDTDRLESNMAGDIAFYARTPSGETPYLLTLNVSATFAMDASIVNQLLVGKITNSGFSVGVVKSAVGDLHGKVINTMVGLAMKLFIIPKLNEKAAHGFPLPVTDKVKFHNSKLQIQKGALMIATDLQYQL